MSSKLSYFPEQDIMHFLVSKGEEAATVELSPNITAELNKKGEIIGMEILHASSFIRDIILDSAQARLVDMKCGPRKAANRRTRLRDHAH
jgi:uncharacterized protein YuzE